MRDAHSFGTTPIGTESADHLTINRHILTRPSDNELWKFIFQYDQCKIACILNAITQHPDSGYSGARATTTDSQWFIWIGICWFLMCFFVVVVVVCMCMTKNTTKKNSTTMINFLHLQSQPTIQLFDACIQKCSFRNGSSIDDLFI